MFHAVTSYLHRIMSGMLKSVFTQHVAYTMPNDTIVDLLSFIATIPSHFMLSTRITLRYIKLAAIKKTPPNSYEVNEEIDK